MRGLAGAWLIGFGLLGAWARAEGPAAADAAAASAPAPLDQAAQRMTVPEGFRVSLFAGEPDVRQPIAMTFDARGRLWVVECYAYPAWSRNGKGHDRVLIFEDTDGDGRFDERKVFWDQGVNLSGVAVGFGGVWLCSTPNFLFVPDRDGDDTPDGPPQVLLDGWDLNSEHNVFNTLTWGPDGWLYGCNGILGSSHVGKPGAPRSERTPFNCGVWRFHPTRQTFEIVARGTTNPWGLDFDDFGEAFITNCVIPHLFHLIPGAHYQRMYGEDFNPHLYSLMPSCADHIHWAGGRWQDSRGGQGKHGEAGGGHAHSGAIVYLGDNWPDRYRGSVLMCNIHGHRLNHDSLARQGSGYVARHEKDFLLANDDWFRGIALAGGPDGGVFLLDWSDTGECHENDADGAHRENGRIYKVTYGQPKPAKVNLAALDDAALVALQTHRNDWHVRQARRVLQERAAAGKDLSQAAEALRAMFDREDEVPKKLRALWALHAIGALDEAALIAKLDHASEHVRAWAVRLLADAKTPGPEALAKLAGLAAQDRSPVVRLDLASTLDRIPLADRWPIAEGLAAHGEDAADANLPLMDWYAIEPLVPADPARALALATSARIPLVRQYTARRAALVEKTKERPTSGLSLLVQALGKPHDAEVERDLLTGMAEALRGRKHMAMPEGWAEAAARLAKSTDSEVRAQARLLSLQFGDKSAAQALQASMLDASAPVSERLRALEALVDQRAPGLAPRLQTLLADPAMRSAAIRGLAAYNDASTASALINRYSALTESEREDVIATLAERPVYALALLEAIERGSIPRRDLTATTARQLQAYADPVIDARLAKVWGSLRPTSKEKSALVAKYKATLAAAASPADPARGRQVFNRTCLQCHRLYDAGGDVGPDLTGSDRANADYILENVLDPSAAVGRDYQLTTVSTTDGRLVSGIVRAQTARTFVLQTVNERVVIDRQDVEEMKTSPSSMMPEGLLEKLSDAEVRDLFAYLRSKEQVPLPAEK